MIRCGDRRTCDGVSKAGLDVAIKLECKRRLDEEATGELDSSSQVIVVLGQALDGANPASEAQRYVRPSRSKVRPPSPKAFALKAKIKTSLKL
ncbi:hypothetical protein GN244_ATG09986 [Phytophthora infestans]|uniref:Uncharacterized protein n=1 Tax=Phytophthora infestans TaxID=4787 RepID=A0A833T6T0_PHYIN|nr:hypothetical protein GN244_ATG09986 [Phytophthora infestans]